MPAMPPIITLIVCKTLIVGVPDQNAGFTGYENREWAYEHSKMICRRQEVQVYDSAEAQGADPQPFNQHRCQRSGIPLGVQWDAAHRNSDYRFWRFACPTPVINTITGEVIAWQMPACPGARWRGVIHCEGDTTI